MDIYLFQKTFRKCVLTSLLFLFGCTDSQANILTMEWSANPRIHAIENASFLKESAIVILDHNQFEVIKATNNQFQFVQRCHKIIRVNDEKGIESFNKTRIRYNSMYPITMIKARSISPSGKVVELDKDAFKEVSNDQGGMEKIFAIEAIEKGSEIEYIFEQNQRFIPFGTEYMQDVIPVIENKFEMISPDHLLFDIKGYNNVVVEKVVTKESKNHWLAYTKNLQGLTEEKYASYLSHFARVEYAIAYNKLVKEDRLYTWDDLLSGIYKGYLNFTEKELKACNKILESQPNYMKLKDIKEKIAWIEDYLKTNFVQQEYVESENASEIDYILKNKITNENGIKNLFACMYLSQRISFDIGFTTDRFMKKFDATFINADNLQHFLLYFPGVRQFMAPNEMYYRTPLIPSQWSGQEGIFSRTSLEGGKLTVIAENRVIPEDAVESNFHDHDVIVTFNADIDTAKIEMKQSFGGHNALPFLPVYILLDKEKQIEVSKEILAINAKQERMDNFSVENNTFASLSTRKPLKVETTIHSNSFIDKAGNKYLLKIGELIGLQSEMYQEKERQFDLEIPNPHQYTRTLSIKIPDGFKLSNLDKLNMNVMAEANGKEGCKFVSSYEMKGNTLNVNIFEIYRNSYTSILAYEPYRRVINAAADFNKLVIIMEKAN